MVLMLQSLEMASVICSAPTCEAAREAKIKFLIFISVIFIFINLIKINLLLSPIFGISDHKFPLIFEIKN